MLSDDVAKVENTLRGEELGSHPLRKICKCLAKDFQFEVGSWLGGL